MIICDININNDVLLIAEIGNNHEGDFGRACEMIAAAAEAGAHVTKFQTIDPKQLVTTDQVDRLAQLTGYCFSPEQIHDLADVAARHKVGFMSTPFSFEAVDLLDPIVPAFKIASGDNDFLPLLQRVARTGKPVLVSTGLSDAAHVNAIRSIFETVWQAQGVSTDKLVLLHCVTSYPTAPADASLGGIAEIKSMGIPAGYSDHTLGIDAAVLSVALGARVIEKHFTLDKNQSTFRDHQLSADPSDFAQLSRRVKEAVILIGTHQKDIRPAEETVRMAVRRGVYAARDINLGEALQEADIDCLRPRVHFSPMDLPKVLGKPLTRNITKGEAISEEDFI